MTTKINYIIATYAGKYPTREKDVHSKDVLDMQLTILWNIFKAKQLENIPNLISQITVVIPPVKPYHNAYDNYYRKDKWEAMFGDMIKFLDYIGENRLHSYDQWVMAMQAYPGADYHLVMEDDYCIQPNCINFDQILVDIYTNKFPKGNGYLCELYHKTDQWIEHAAISNGLISNTAFTTIHDPLKYLNDSQYHCQLSFSLLFIYAGLLIRDYTDQYDAPFWQSSTQQIENPVNRPLIGKTLIIPVQMLYNIDIKYN